MKAILQRDEKVLREVAKPIPIRSIKTAKIKKVIEEMKESLKSQSDGVAIAAPQIGYSLRIFVVSGQVFEKDFDKGERPEPNSKTQTQIKDKVFINPKIIKLSKAKEWTPEGCLSVRWLYGETHRHKKATVEAYDENGKKFTRGGSGLLAQIFQHETDHLDGILFIDHGKNIREEKPH